ncbi:alpha/beta hydrolase [Mycobacterium sp. PS03-16]|nr:alpha/beta hydrolase [Mycobacterium sp. PS03-16]
MRFTGCRSTACLLLVAVVAGGVTACGETSNEPQAPYYEAAPCPRPNYPGVPAADLGPEYTCGYLTVPENRRAPGGRTIKLLVARARAVSDAPAPDPIVYLAGGPGGAGTLSAPGVIAGGMNTDRDVIFLNPRGTIHSDPFLPCPETDEFASQAIGLVYTEQSTARRDAESVASCRERLAPTGADFAAYNSLENAADVADLRVALGIEEWNLYGVSYGTDLAQQVLRDHPDGVRSVVLDSVVPVGENLVDRWWQAPASSLAAIAQACTTESACAARYPDVTAQFTTAVNALNQAPADVTVTGTNGRPLAVTVDGFKLVSLIVAWTTDQTKVTDIPRMISAAARGDVQLAAEGIAAGDLPPDQWGLLGSGLAFGAYCQEMAAWTTPEQALAEARKAMRGLPDSVLRITPTGSYMFDECRAWGLGRSDPAARAPASSDLPTLILSGTFDASTAPAWVDDIKGGFPNAVVLHFPGLGHGVLPPSACAQSIMTAFLDQPGPDVDRSCIAGVRVPTFAPA